MHHVFTDSNVHQMLLQTAIKLDHTAQVLASSSRRLGDLQEVLQCLQPLIYFSYLTGGIFKHTALAMDSDCCCCGGRFLLPVVTAASADTDTTFACQMCCNWHQLLLLLEIQLLLLLLLLLCHESTELLLHTLQCPARRYCCPAAITNWQGQATTNNSTTPLSVTISI